MKTIYKRKLYEQMLAWKRQSDGHTASLFKEILSEEEFKGVFRRVLFVIKEDYHSPKHGNFAPFAKLFGSIDKSARIEPME